MSGMVACLGIAAGAALVMMFESGGRTGREPVVAGVSAVPDAMTTSPVGPPVSRAADPSTRSAGPPPAPIALRDASNPSRPAGLTVAATPAGLRETALRETATRETALRQTAVGPSVERGAAAPRLRETIDPPRRGPVPPASVALREIRPADATVPPASASQGRQPRH